MTLPPDTSLDDSSGYASLMVLVDDIVDRGGVVVVTLHPQPHQSANERGLGGFFDFLQAVVLRHGDALWHATPREIVERYADAMTARAWGGANRCC